MPRARGSIRTLRDAHITQSFFGQTTPCPCSPDCPHTLGGTLKADHPAAESSSAQSAQQRGPSVLKHLSLDAYQKLRSFAANGRSVIPPNVKLEDVCELLTNALCWVKDREVKAEAFAPNAKFDLSHIGAVTWEYERASLKCAQSEERERRNNKELIDELNSQWKNEQPSSDILESIHQATNTSFNRSMWCIHEIMAQLRFVFIRPLQLFIVEKRFGFLEETLAMIMFEHATEPGFVSPKKPSMTLRQIFDSPEFLLPDSDAIKAKQDRDRERQQRRKESDWLELLVTFKKNYKEMVELIEAQKGAIDDKPAQIKLSTMTFGYVDVEIPHNIPRKIRRRLCDFSFVSEDMENLAPVVSELRDRARSRLMYWFSTNREAWQYGKKHVHEMPSMRKYEYHRKSFAAMYTVATHEYLKIAKYFKSKRGSTFLTPTLAEALNLGDDRTFEQTKADWLISKETCHDEDCHTSVDEMIIQLDGMWASQAGAVGKAITDRINTINRAAGKTAAV